MSDEMLEFFAPETAKKAHKPLETRFEVVIPFDTQEDAENFCIDAKEGGGYMKAEVREVAK